MDPPSELSIDALNTATPNLADEPTLANGPPSELRIDALHTTTVHQTWQTNLLWLMDSPVLKSSGPQWQFHIATDFRVVTNGNFTLLLTSTGQEWLFHTATDI